MFGPESIGKHITQLVANWVFPRESVFGPESIGKRITQLVASWVFPRESVFGPESIGKHITQLIANWVFPSETEYIAGGLLRKSTYPGTATPTQLQMYATDLRGEPRRRQSLSLVEGGFKSDGYSAFMAVRSECCYL